MDRIAFGTGKRGQRRRCLFKTVRTPLAASWFLALWAWLAIFPANQAARAGTLVQFNFNVTNGVNNQQSVLVDLFDDLTPHTVGNFMSYVNSGEYQNTVIHRSIPGFIIQGGGYGIPAILNDASPLTHIATSFPSPVNEFSRTNTRGTIAMAKVGGNPNSATSEWFFNLADNSANLDTQNGGFTAFGWVVGSGMTNVVDKIAADPTFNYKNFTAQTGQSPSFPAQNFTAGNPVALSNLIILNSIAIVSIHPSFQNPAPNLTDDVNNDGFVHANDVNTVITDLLNNNNQPHALTGPFSGTNYVDVNGDGKVSASDVHLVIDALLALPPQSQSSHIAMSGLTATGMAMSMSMAIVPEPSSCVLAATGTLALGVYVLRRRRRVEKNRSTQ